MHFPQKEIENINWPINFFHSWLYIGYFGNEIVNKKKWVPLFSTQMRFYLVSAFRIGFAGIRLPAYELSLLYFFKRQHEKYRIKWGTKQENS